jgi:hypothetical protein
MTNVFNQVAAGSRYWETFGHDKNANEVFTQNVQAYGFLTDCK